MHVLHRSEKNGIGPAYLAGFRHALERGAGYVMEMDSDFSHDPADLARLLAAVDRDVPGSADLALGSRYVPGGGVSDWGWLRRFISEGGSTYSRIVLGLKVRDLTGGFKCFRREVLEAIHFDGVRSQGYAFQVELTYRAVRAGFHVVEVPIVFRDRQRRPEQDVLADRRRGDVARAAAALQIADERLALQIALSAADAEGMDASAYAFTHGVRQTRETLRMWQRSPRRARGRWFAGSALAAIGLLLAVWCIASLSPAMQQIVILDPPFAVGGVADVAQHARAQLARARPARDGLRRGLHRRQLAAAAGRAPLRASRAGSTNAAGASRSASSSLATTFSLSAQAYVLGHTLAGVSAFLHVSPGLLLLGLLPHAIIELIALFLPLAAWIIASRRGEWDQLLAATFVTVAIAVPMLVLAALIEVYVSPHLFTTLTEIHPPIMRTDGERTVTVHAASALQELATVLDSAARRCRRRTWRSCETPFKRSVPSGSTPRSHISRPIWLVLPIAGGLRGLPSAPDCVREDRGGLLSRTSMTSATRSTTFEMLRIASSRWST